MSSQVSDVLKERGARYGAFRTHAQHSQVLKEHVLGRIFWDPSRKDINDVISEGMEMILHKIARVMNGDPYYADNWIDIAGYAQLVADELSDKIKI